VGIRLFHQNSKDDHYKALDDHKNKKTYGKPQGRSPKLFKFKLYTIWLYKKINFEKHLTRWKHCKIYKKVRSFQNSWKMVQFLTQVKECRLKIIENNIIKAWCFFLNL